jgi:hypothetical protein
VLETIGECLAGAYANGRLVPHEGALQWVASAEDDLERVLWEIGRAAGGWSFPPPRPRARLRRVRLRLVVRRRHEEPQPTLVRYEAVRKQGKAPSFRARN